MAECPRCERWDSHSLGCALLSLQARQLKAGLGGHIKMPGWGPAEYVESRTSKTVKLTGGRPQKYADKRARDREAARAYRARKKAA